MTKKRSIIIFIILLFILTGLTRTLAQDGPVKLPKSIPGIGEVTTYKIGENIYIGPNFNYDLLIIATLTGTGFSHSGYGNMDNPLLTRIKDQYQQYQDNKAAKRLAAMVAQIKYPPSKRFGNSIVEEVLAYEELCSTTLRHKLPQLTGTSVKKTVRSFGKTTQSENLLKADLDLYNQMIEAFVTKYDFNFVSSIEKFFGFEMKRDRFEVIVSPVMDGGQSLRLNNRDGSVTNFMILSPYGRTDEQILGNLVYHETIHSFMKVVRINAQSSIDSYGQFREALNNQSNFTTMLDETVTRAISFIMLSTYHQPDMAKRLIDQELQRGWKNVDEIYFLIKNKYISQRDQYPTFESFLPVILQYIEAKTYGKPFDIGPKTI